MQDKEVGNGNTNCPNGTRGKWHNIFIGRKHHLIYQLLLLLNQLFIQGHWDIWERSLLKKRGNIIALCHIVGGVMVSVLISSVVDHGFESRSGQTKDYEIGTCIC